MAHKKNTRSTWSDVTNPTNVLAAKLSSQGDGTGITSDAIAGVAIVSTTDATPIVVTTAGHTKNNGDLVFIRDHTTNVNANGLHIVANEDATTFELTDLLGVDVAGSGAGAGGADGTIYPCLWYKVLATELLLLESFSLHAADSSMAGAGYMALAALTNGMLLDIYRGTTLRASLQAAPVQDFADWGFVPGLVVVNGTETVSSDAIAHVAGAFQNAPLLLDGRQDDSIILIAQDNLSGLIHQESAIGGELESTV